MNLGPAALRLAIRVFTSPAGLAALAGACIAIGFASRRGRICGLRQLHSNQRGDAEAMDLVMVTPVFVYVMLMVTQFAILLRDSAIVDYAAFVAARSARVHMCPWPKLTEHSLLEDLLGKRSCDDDTEPAKRAARYALIPASPADSTLDCTDCEPPTGLMDALAAGTDTTRYLSGWYLQARYAFDTDNVAVDLDMPVIEEIATLTQDNPRELPAVATVTFRHTLIPLMGPVFGDGKRGDGVPYTLMQSQVTLL